MSKEMTLVLTEIRKLNDRFDSVDHRLGTLEQGFDSLEQRFDSLEQRFDSLEQRVDSLGKRVDYLGRGVDSLGQRVDKLSEEIVTVKTEVKNNHQQTMKAINELRADLYLVKKQTARNYEWQVTMENSIDERISELESDIKILKMAVAN